MIFFLCFFFYQILSSFTDKQESCCEIELDSVTYSTALITNPAIAILTSLLSAYLFILSIYLFINYKDFQTSKLLCFKSRPFIYVAYFSVCHIVLMADINNY